mmetsp:Transcript_56308/g.155863  ORF Transcript_56308/g.155863 Transcript_56308/m.155863 type:complete len:430 (+) Transcript_56308:398-1687(+)
MCSRKLLCRSRNRASLCWSLGGCQCRNRCWRWRRQWRRRRHWHRRDRRWHRAPAPAGRAGSRRRRRVPRPACVGLSLPAWPAGPRGRRRVALPLRGHCGVRRAEVANVGPRRGGAPGQEPALLLGIRGVHDLQLALDLHGRGIVGLPSHLCPLRVPADPCVRSDGGRVAVRVGVAGRREAGHPIADGRLEACLLHVALFGLIPTRLYRGHPGVVLVGCICHGLCRPRVHPGQTFPSTVPLLLREVRHASANAVKRQRCPICMEALIFLIHCQLEVRLRCAASLVRCLGSLGVLLERVKLPILRGGECAAASADVRDRAGKQAIGGCLGALCVALHLLHVVPHGLQRPSQGRHLGQRHLGAACPCRLRGPRLPRLACVAKRRRMGADLALDAAQGLCVVNGSGLQCRKVLQHLAAAAVPRHLPHLHQEVL